MLENLAERVGRLESFPVPTTPPSVTGVPSSTISSSCAPSMLVPTAQVPTLAVLTPSSKKTVATILERTPQRHKAALKLLAVKFTKEELTGANCAGSQGKSKLDTTRLALIRRIIFEKYPIDVAAEEREETVWRAICKRIDAKCRGTTFFSKF